MRYTIRRRVNVMVAMQSRLSIDISHLIFYIVDIYSRENPPVLKNLQSFTVSLRHAQFAFKM